MKESLNFGKKKKLAGIVGIAVGWEIEKRLIEILIAIMIG